MKRNKKHITCLTACKHTVFAIFMTTMTLFMVSCSSNNLVSGRVITQMLEAGEPVMTVEKGKVPFSWLVLVKRGTFVMGANENDNSAYKNEKPAHKVKLSHHYYISLFEVTQSLWETVMGNNPSYFKGKNLPVEEIS